MSRRSAYQKRGDEEFVKRLAKTSKEFRDTIAVTDWIDKEINN